MGKRFLLLSGAVAFLTAVIAIQGHAAVVRIGYEISALEKEVHALEVETDRGREEVSRLQAPARLLARAREFGLVPDAVTEAAIAKAEQRRRAAMPMLAQR